MSQPRMSRDFENFLIATFVIVLFGIANYLAFRHYRRWDWTRAQIFTLSGRTEEVLRRLDKPVEIYVFLSPLEPQYGEVNELLLRYRSKTSKITVRTIDPNTKPDEFRVVAERLGVLSTKLETDNVVADVAVVLTSGDKKWKITADDFSSIDFDAMGGESKTSQPEQLVKMEQALTGGILQVLEGRATKICVTKGHGEWPVDAGGDRSLMTLRDELQRDNVTMESFDTLGQKNIPAGCDAVFVVGPLSEFSADESDVLIKYVQNGGNMLLTLDPLLEHGAIRKTGLEPFARELGVSIDEDVVLEMDSSHLLQDSPLGAFVVSDYGDHATTKLFAKLNARTVFRFARSIRVNDESHAKVLLKTSANSYAESSASELAGDVPPQKGSTDIEGPVPIAVAIEAPPLQKNNAKRAGRVVMVGSSQWLTPQLLMAAQVQNFDLASAWVGWLTERPELISIPPRKVTAHPMTMTESDVFWLFFRLVVFMPLSVFMMGLAVWRARRS